MKADNLCLEYVENFFDFDQNRLFGSHTRWFYDPGCPDQTLEESTVKSWAAQAVLRSAYPDPGPVHLNIPFREPFLSNEPSKPIFGFI